MGDYAWLMAPHEYEPDYDAYWLDLESLETAMANVGSYDDWFPEADDGWKCPINYDGCTANCGNYGCGN